MEDDQYTHEESSEVVYARQLHFLGGVTDIGCSNGGRTRCYCMVDDRMAYQLTSDSLTAESQESSDGFVFITSQIIPKNVRPPRQPSDTILWLCHKCHCSDDHASILASDITLLALSEQDDLTRFKHTCLHIQALSEILGGETRMIKVTVQP